MDATKGWLSRIRLNESTNNVRPPYCDNYDDFDACLECKEKHCAQVCEEGIIVIDSNGKPFLDVSQNGCTFCEACAQACKNDVLVAPRQAVIFADVLIDTQRCVAHHGVICMACKEPCLDDAILFRGLFAPVIDEQACSGCGFCVSRCPSQAMIYRKSQVTKTEREDEGV